MKNLLFKKNLAFLRYGGMLSVPAFYSQFLIF